MGATRGHLRQDRYIHFGGIVAQALEEGQAPRFITSLLPIQPLCFGKYQWKCNNILNMNGAATLLSPAAAVVFNNAAQQAQ